MFQEKKGIALMLGLCVILSLFSCKHEPDSKPVTNPTVCKCPNGTNHPTDPCDCGADDCECTNNPIVVETPELRTETINLEINATPCTAIVKGTLTATQWEGLATRIESVIQSSYDNAPFIQKLPFVSVFEGGKAVVVVKKSAVSQCSVINMYEVEFDFDYLAGQSDEALAISFLDVVAEMENAPVPQVTKAQSTVITGLFNNNASATVKGTFTDSEWAGVAAMAKAIVPVPKYNRAMQLRDNRVASRMVRQRIG